MTVPAQVSLYALREQLPAAAAYAAAAGLELDSSFLSDLRLYVKFENMDGERFFVEIDFRDYPMYPPTIEFLDADRGQRGTPHHYPSCFHPMPCVCTRYSRKAYTERGGPHGDWRMIDWQLPTGNGSPIDTPAAIISDLHSKISHSQGRLG